MPSLHPTGNSALAHSIAHPCTLHAGDADRAEQLLLASLRPSAAIELRRGLGHWERALELAEHLEPHALGGLALLRAQAMEAEGQVGCWRSLELVLHG